MAGLFTKSTMQWQRTDEVNDMDPRNKQHQNNSKSGTIEEKKMKTINENLGSNIGGLGTLVGTKTMRLLGGLVLVGMLAMASVFSTVSADIGPVHQAAGDYTVSPPVLSGPPSTENGVTSIAGTVAVELRGTQIGSALVHFTCDLGTGPGGSNQCEGSFLFEGTFRGEAATYRGAMTNWTAGGEEAFTWSEYKLISGSGTGALSNLVALEGLLLRDEAAGPVGIYTGAFQFEIAAVEVPLSEVSLHELFIMEVDGTITTEELVAELTLRAESK
jgi:hypothetical protein